MKPVRYRDEDRQLHIDKSLDDLAFYLDGLFRIPGTDWRFGLDGLIGLIPNVGDRITTFVSFYILLAGVRYGVPKITHLRMAFNIAVDYLVGSIPVIGDAFDFVWKSNHMNMNLIRTRAAGRGKGKKSDYVFVFGIILLLIGILIASILISLYLIGSVIRGFTTGSF